MAITRKRIDQIKFVLKSDPAVDKETYKDYEENLFEIEKLKKLNGEDWTEFVLEPLTRRQKTGIKNSVNRRQEMEFTVQFALRNIRNFILVSANGQKKEIGQPKRDEVGGIGYMVNDEYFDELDLTDSELEEICLAVEKISGLAGPL